MNDIYEDPNPYKVDEAELFFISSDDEEPYKPPLKWYKRYLCCFWYYKSKYSKLKQINDYDF